MSKFLEDLFKSRGQSASPSAALGKVLDISVKDLSAMLADADHPKVIDVREPWEYEQGHVPGAILMPLGSMASQVSRLDPSQPLVLICAHGNRSRSAAAFLHKKGFETLYNVSGGTAAWQRARLPLKTERR